MDLLLDRIRKGLPTLTTDMGRFLSEAALFCLVHNRHQSGVGAQILDKENETVKIRWSFVLDQRSSDTYRDLPEVTEYGASCIAILLATYGSEKLTVQRSAKGTGFDYWIGEYSNERTDPFKHMKRLEISGILKGVERDIRSRIKLKCNQVKISDRLGYPSVVIIVEFSNPILSMVEK